MKENKGTRIFDILLPLKKRRYDNVCKAQWELFLKHVWSKGDFKWDLLEGVKGVQLVELGLQSWKERRWVDVPRLEAE